MRRYWVGGVHRTAEQVEKPGPRQFRNLCPVLGAGTNKRAQRTSGSRLRSRAISMLMIKARRPAIRTLPGWAISVLQEAGAIRECEEHGWMQDRADPHTPRARVRHRAPDPFPDCHPGRLRLVAGRTCQSSTNTTGVPFDTRSATRSASQFVRRMHPCDSDLDTFPGEGVPWMP